ncbi:MAG TPA: glycosyltransferase family 4 protein [Ktedonobacterales bacterium]|jgi:glycosyltransferase involved in cell wall biosynthesis|nr:glycosyltransferase family 4 protein [Ktedonobacterales bacterium]
MRYTSGSERAPSGALDSGDNLSIMMISGTFFPIVGGTETSTLREAIAFREHGHEVRVLTLRHDESWPRCEVLQGVPVQRTGGLFVRGRLRVRFGVSLLAEARVFGELMRSRHTYDVVQLRQLGRLARPAVLASLLTRKPLIVRIAAGPSPGQGRKHRVSLLLHPGHLDPQSSVLHVRDMTADFGDIDALRSTQWLSWLTLRLLRSPHVTFLALSKRVRAHLIECGFRDAQIVTIPNGIDIASYREVADTAERRHAQRAQSQGIIVCTARYSYQKGQDVLLHAWRTVHERIASARLVLAGDGALRPQLEALAQALEIADSVDFAGLVADVPALLARSDGFVLPSRYEGMPNALLEAMAAGLPCVATRVSGSEDIIVDGESGLLVPADDPHALATALIAILSDRARARSIGRAAYDRVRYAFNRERQVEQLIRLCDALVSAAGAKDKGAREKDFLRDSARSTAGTVMKGGQDCGDDSS